MYSAAFSQCNPDIRKEKIGHGGCRRFGLGFPVFFTGDHAFMYVVDIRFFCEVIMLKKPYLILPVILILMAVGCVLREDLVPMENRLLALEQRNMDLVRQADAAQSRLERLQGELDGQAKERGTETQDLRSQSASIRAELTRVEEELRLVSGRLEEMEHTMTQAAGNSQSAGGLADLGRIVTRNSERLLRLERYLNLEPAAQMPTITPGDQTQPLAPATGSQTSVAPPETTPAQPPVRPEDDLSDEALYAKGKQAFDMGNHQQAREYFQKLIQDFPKSPRADNAQFWIGETYYREKWYEKAILEYQNVIEKYP